MQLSEVDLLKLQTKVMQNNEDVQGFSAALSAQYKKLAQEINRILIYGNTTDLPEAALDILAWSMKVDWYDANSTLEMKQRAINDALLVAQIRGTPGAVEKVVEIYFGEGTVEEWFEYGGQPFHFRIVTNNRKVNNEQVELFTRAVESVKNIRSRLQEVIIIYISWNEIDQAFYSWDSIDAEGMTWDQFQSWTPKVRTSIALTFSDE